MDKKLEKILILASDFISVNVAFVTYFWIRTESGLFTILASPDIVFASTAVYLFWLVIFTIAGLYRTWFASSRFDELTLVLKTTFFGVLFLFFLIFIDDYAAGVSDANRMLIFIYFFLMLGFVSAGRLLIRKFQRNLLLKGIGRRNAAIVGFNSRGHNIHNMIDTYKALGLDVKAYICLKEENFGKEHNGVPAVDNYNNIEKVVNDYKIKEIIIALEKQEHDVMIGIISKSDDLNVGLKIVPDLYDVISGQARTSQLYGYPLIDIKPQLLNDWEKFLKRTIDIMASIVILLITMPVTLITAMIIKTDKGPALFKQERSGLKGKPFMMYKFRSMIMDAEKYSGPMWSVKDDPRITKIGKFIRKVRIDEIPQMINVLKGEMSLVGPRPERPFFVEKLAQDIPLYKRRLSVRPGVTGWAQVNHKYDETIEDVKMKLQYDLFYIENISVRLDLKIIWRTVFVVLFGKGHFG